MVLTVSGHSRAAPLPLLLGATSLSWLLAAGYLFFLPVQWPLQLGMRLAPSDFFAVLYLGLLATRISIPRESWSIWHFALPFALLLGLLVSLISAGFVTVYAAGQKVTGLVLLLAVYVMFADLGRIPGHARRSVRLLIGVAAAHAACALLAFALGVRGLLQLDWINYAGVRLSGFLVDPNAFGGLLATSLALHLTLQKSAEPLFSSRAGALITWLLATGLLLTFSRSAWLGFSLVLACWLTVRRRAIGAFLTSATAAGIVAVAVLGWSFLGFMGAMAARPEQVFSRLDLLEKAVEMFAASPLLGGGTGVFLATHGEIVHSTAFWLLAETGLMGLLAFAGFAFWFVRHGIAGYRRGAGGSRELILALLLAHVAMIGVSVGIEALYQRHWWVVLGLLGVTAAGPAVSTDARERERRHAD